MGVYSGLGSVLLGSQDANGKLVGLRNVGETDPAKGVSIDPKFDVFDVMGGSVAAGRSIIQRLVQGRQATVKIPLLEWNKENLALRLLGDHSVIAAGTVTGEVLEDDLVAGALVSLQKGHVSDVVIHDSAGTPVTVPTSKYAFNAYGTGSFSDVAGYTQPFKADYAYGSVINIPMLAGQLREQWVRFEGLNTADVVSVLIDLYRVSFEPTKSLALIQQKGIEIGELEGILMADRTKALDPVLGQFGRIQILASAY